MGLVADGGARQQTPVLVGERLRLEPFTEAHVSERYLGWLNDPEVTRFLEVRFAVQTREQALGFVRSFWGSVEKYMWAIVEVEEGAPIGTCTLYNVNRHHGSAELGLLIGEKRHWGTSASQDAITLIGDFAFGALGVRRLTGGTYARNHGMNFTYRQLGFSLEGRMKQAYRCGDEYVDGYRWGILAGDWHARRADGSERG